MTAATKLADPLGAHPSETARRAMIDSQLRVSGVNDPAVLAAMAAVAREDFVPEAARAAAYVDRAVSLGDGRALPAPLVHGRILTEAAITPDDTVLVIAAAGYLPALAAQFGCTVTALSPEDAVKAKRRSAPVSLILIDGAVEEIPANLVSLLSEGGRVVTGLAERGVTRLAAGTRVNGELALLPIADIGMPVLREFAKPKGWSF